ncbi:flagellar basal body rod protein FlgF [Vibrio breoganii]
MEPVLFNASQAATRAMEAQQVRANNLANVSTTGFKAVLENSEPMKLFGSGFESTVTARSNSAINDFSQGHRINTGNPLHLMIDGGGFFAVSGEGDEPAELYTRKGEFSINGEGMLTLSEREVVGVDGAIEVPEFLTINVNEEGVISITPVDGDAAIVEVGQLKLVQPDISDVTLHESGFFTSISDQGAYAQSQDVVLASGSLEGSNVSSVNELHRVVQLSRTFELQIKMMSTAIEMAEKGNQLLRA